MRQRLVILTAERPALVAAVVALLAAAAPASVLAVADGVPRIAIPIAALATLAMAVLAALVARTLSGDCKATHDAAVRRIGDLALACSRPVDTRAEGLSQQQALDRDISVIARAHRSLQRERERSQGALEEQVARQADFYAHLSHELRSPLNAILGYTALAIEDAEGGKLADLPDDLRKIRGAGQTLLALIDNLLQLADDRIGRETLARAPFPLRDVLSRILAEHGRKGSAIRLTLAEDAAGQTLFGNREKVKRAICSIIDDAVRSRLAREIAISTRDDLAQGASVEIVFAMICDPVARGRDREALTRHLADRLAGAVAGRLRREERSDGGWNYILRLPLDVDAPDSCSIITRETAGEGSRPAAAGGGKSALVIDDDPATVDLMARWLERGGYTVRSAANAEQGLALAQADAPDIVLLDALMPGRSGYDILPVLSALPALQDTPILLVTVDDDRLRGLAAGASDYVRKPVTESRLREVLAVYENKLDGEVLIVDDDGDAAELLQRTIRRLGFRTRLAGDGAAGLAALKERAPSAIVLDLNMPKLDGFGFIEMLGRSKRYRGIPLMVVSGQQLSVAQHHRLVAAGCRYYMKGNTAPREIAETLKEMVA